MFTPEVPTNKHQISIVWHNLLRISTYKGKFGNNIAGAGLDIGLVLVCSCRTTFDLSEDDATASGAAAASATAAAATEPAAAAADAEPAAADDDAAATANEGMWTRKVYDVSSWFYCFMYDLSP